MHKQNVHICKLLQLFHIRHPKANISTKYTQSHQLQCYFVPVSWFLCDITILLLDGLVQKVYDHDHPATGVILCE